MISSLEWTSYRSTRLNGTLGSPPSSFKVVTLNSLPLEFHFSYSGLSIGIAPLKKDSIS